MNDRRGGQSEPGKSTICQLARMGDLVQMLPLISALPQGGSLKLICDADVLDWAEQLPQIDEIIPVNTRRMRQSTLGELSLPQVLRELDISVEKVSHFTDQAFYALNDHPVCDALAALVCHENQSLWVNPRLVLLRSYVRMIAAEHRWNRIHLSDLWASLAFPEKPDRNVNVPAKAAGRQFAKSVVEPLHQSGVRRIWAFILGSGGKYRRIAPEDFSAYWNHIAENSHIGLVLIGGRGEEELARRFLQNVDPRRNDVINLVGVCSPEELLGLFAEVDLVVGVDTGPLHWAAAVGTRVLGMYFAEAGFYDTGPYGQGHFVLVPDCPEYPCHPVVAEKCDYKCRRPFEDHRAIAELLKVINDELWPEEYSVPTGLHLHRSSLTAQGNRYEVVAGKANDPEIDYLADFVWKVFAEFDETIRKLPRIEGRYNDSGRLFQGGGIPQGTENQRDNFERLFNRWVDEIWKLPLPKAISSTAEFEVKEGAATYLSAQKKSLRQVGKNKSELDLQKCESCL